MKIAFFYLCLAFSIAAPLSAQNEDVNPSSAGKSRVAHFVYTAMPAGVENPISIMTGKEIIGLTLSKRSASEAVKIPTDGILRVVRKIENPEDPNLPKYLTLAQANIPEGVNKALIILVPVAANPSGLVFQAKVQDLAAFKGGDFLYLNLTKMNVGVELGNTKLEIKPGEIKIYNAPTLTTSINVPVSYNFYHPKEKQWTLISASTIALHSTRREICIFSWDSGYERIDYHGITFPVM
jgi:hypothetical protein